MSLKENQQELYEDTVCGFKFSQAEGVSEEWEYDCEWFETRKCSIIRSEDVLLSENVMYLKIFYL